MFRLANATASNVTLNQKQQEYFDNIVQWKKENPKESYQNIFRRLEEKYDELTFSNAQALYYNKFRYILEDKKVPKSPKTATPSEAEGVDTVEIRIQQLPVRVAEIDGVTYIVAKDILKSIGISTTSSYLDNLLTDENKKIVWMQSPRGLAKTLIVKIEIGVEFLETVIEKHPMKKVKDKASLALTDLKNYLISITTAKINLIGDISSLIEDDDFDGPPTDDLRDDDDEQVEVNLATKPEVVEPKQETVEQAKEAPKSEEKPKSTSKAKATSSAKTSDKPKAKKTEKPAEKTKSVAPKAQKAKTTSSQPTKTAEEKPKTEKTTPPSSPRVYDNPYSARLYEENEKVEFKVEKIDTKAVIGVTKDGYNTPATVFMSDVIDDEVSSLSDFFTVGETVLASVLYYDDKLSRLVLSTKESMNASYRMKQRAGKVSNFVTKRDEKPKGGEQSSNSMIRKQPSSSVGNKTFPDLPELSIRANKELNSIIQVIGHGARIGALSPEAKRKLIELLNSKGIAAVSMKIQETIGSFQPDLGLLFLKEVEKNIKADGL